MKYGEYNYIYFVKKTNSRRFIYRQNTSTHNVTVNKFDNILSDFTHLEKKHKTTNQ